MNDFPPPAALRRAAGRGVGSRDVVNNPRSKLKRPKETVMFANARVLILAVLVAGGLLAASGDAQAQHRRVSGGAYYHGGYVPSYSHGYAPTYYHGGVYPAGYGYYATPGYAYPAAGSYYSGATFYQPTVWHAGAVHTPYYHGTYYHVGPAYYPPGGHYRSYIIRH